MAKATAIVCNSRNLWRNGCQRVALHHSHVEILDIILADILSDRLARRWRVTLAGSRSEIRSRVPDVASADRQHQRLRGRRPDAPTKFSQSPRLHKPSRHQVDVVVRIN